MTPDGKTRIATVETGPQALAQGDLLETRPDGSATVATGPTRRATGPLVPSLRGPGQA